MFAKTCISLFLLTLSLLSISVGCSNQPVEPVANDEDKPKTNEVVKTNPASKKDSVEVRGLVTKTQDPKQTTEMFLEALKAGDKTMTSNLLTQKAKEETSKEELVVSPPGYASANFVVGNVVYMTSAKNGAHVESHWVDADESGKPKSYEITWILRYEPGGWRIAGMATELFAGEPPLVLNFEDAKEFLHQQMLAEQEITRRMHGEIGSSKIQQVNHTEAIKQGDLPTNNKAGNPINSFNR